MRNYQGNPTTEEQRTRRPLSPHLTIYQPQLTWLMSIGHRMTGAGLATLMYAFGIYYGLTGPGAITAGLVEAVGEAPAAMVGLGKFILATPFFYHTFNGIRHLVWDTGMAFSLRATYMGGWMVNVGSILAGLAVSSLC